MAIPKLPRFINHASVLSIVAATALAAQTSTTRVAGRVLDHGSGDPVAGASVGIGNGLKAVTDKRGWFIVSEIPPGRQAIAVEMLGYQPRTDSIAVESARTTDVEIRLSRKPIQLPPLTVTVRSAWLEENGFYDRRASGLSPRVVTAADIERRGRSTLTDVFTEIQSLRVITVGNGNSSVRRVVRVMSGTTDQNSTLGGARPRRPVNPMGDITESRLPGCEPALFIDGRRYRDRLDPTANGVIDTWDVISPLIIDAIEIYRGGGGPSMYNDNCGSILIWTKRGR